MIIDSSYLFDLMAKDPDAFSKGAELVEDGEMQWLPTPVVAEAYYGVFTARSNTTEKAVRNHILGYPRIDIDEEIARKAGKLGRRPWRERQRRGERRVHRRDGRRP
jgi:predicted nucleic acid-binding protein